MARYEHFDHDADIGVVGRGGTMAEAFEQAALGMTAVITDPSLVEPKATVTIECEAPDSETLLYEFLNRVVFEMATRHMLFRGFSVELMEGRLHALARGEKVDRIRHEPAVEIKGATYTSLIVKQERDGSWRAQCVVDV
jgi:SHS2 domain-containing protein